MPPISKRLRQRLTEEQREEVKRAMLDYAVDLEFTAKDLFPDEKLAEKLLEYLVDFNSEWDGLDESMDWKSSVAHAHFLEIMKNQLRERFGDVLMQA